jgi:hypothetical protein
MRRDVMRARNGRDTRGEGAFGIIIGIIVLVAAVTSGIKIIPLYIHGNEIYDAMNEAANFGGLKPLEKLQADVYNRAQEAGVPLNLAAIHVDRNGPYIVISAKYKQTVDVFGFKYVYNFDKKVEKLVF